MLIIGLLLLLSLLLLNPASAAAPRFADGPPLVSLGVGVAQVFANH